MERMQKEFSYDSSCERDLIKMWEDIKGSDTTSLNRSLMKVIAKNEENEEEQKIVVGEENELFAIQMWDSEMGEWVPFSMWGANYIVNVRKEYVAIRMFQNAPVQPEYGKVLKGWLSVDSSFLNEQLREKESAEAENPFNMAHKSKRSFYEMVAQDAQEYRKEGRYDELLGNYRNRRV